MKHRKLTVLESRMKRKYTWLTRWPKIYSVRIQVGCQGFNVGGSFETRCEAEWMRDMLAIALAKIVALGK